MNIPLAQDLYTKMRMSDNSMQKKGNLYVCMYCGIKVPSLYEVEERGMPAATKDKSAIARHLNGCTLVMVVSHDLFK